MSGSNQTPKLAAEVQTAAKAAETAATSFLRRNIWALVALCVVALALLAWVAMG